MARVWFGVGFRSMGVGYLLRVGVGIIVGSNFWREWLGPIVGQHVRLGVCVIRLLVGVFCMGPLLYLQFIPFVLFDQFPSCTKSTNLKMSDVIPPNDHGSYPGDQPWYVPFPSPPGTPNNDPTSSRRPPIFVMANLTNKLNKAYAREVKQTMKAKSRSTKLDWLKVKLEETKKDVVHKFTEFEEFNHQMVESFDNGFKMFRYYASVISPDYNWSEIDVADVW
ncbi:unnamed protein product [Prunus brigantina]